MQRPDEDIAPILLAEDDPTMRELVATVLRADGYGVLEASDGAELLARIEAAIADPGRRAPPISLLVSDVRMPGMSGLDVLALLRCGHWTTPVILVTAFPEAAVRWEAMQLGATAVLEKPVDIDVLRAAVCRALNHPTVKRGFAEAAARTRRSRFTLERAARRPAHER
jgi:CheY-like chemotaxis protein